MDIQNVTLLGQSEVNDLVKSQIEEILAVHDDSPIVMEKAGTFDSITNVKLFDLPVGQAAVGGLTAMIISSVVDMAMQPIRDKIGTRMGDTLLKAGAAYVVNKWGKDLLGNDAKKAAVIILAWEAFESLVPELTSWVHSLMPNTPTGLTTSPIYQLPANQAVATGAIPVSTYAGVASRFG